MSYKIDKNVPIPEDVHSAGEKRATYPFADLEIGDSFFVEGKTTMTSTLNSASRRLGFKFASKVEVVNGVEGLRIWRTEGAVEVKKDAPRPRKRKAAATVEVPVPAGEAAAA